MNPKILQYLEDYLATLKPVNPNVNHSGATYRNELVDLVQSLRGAK